MDHRQNQKINTLSLHHIASLSVNLQTYTPITGDRGHNLQKAIDRYEAALTIYTKDAFPHDHAIATQNLQIARDTLDNLR